ncbi:MAG: helix-turn-helix domain-containing protein [Gammaproteobacteria bacterium]|nr:helix-turn-helix domain-containing protein [Gammaproteobacteria bacterium]
MSLGARLKQLRTDKKKGSLQNVADDIGISKAHVWELERGTTKNPSIELLKKFANYYSVSIDYLIGNDNDNTGTSPDILSFARELSEKNLDPSDLAVLRAAAEALYNKKNA